MITPDTAADPATAADFVAARAKEPGAAVGAGARADARPGDSAQPAADRLVRCTPADAPALAALRREREQWMQEQGITQWKLGSLPEEKIREQIADGDWFALLIPDGPHAGEIGAAARILDADPLYWGHTDLHDDPATYTHALMVSPRAAGRGFAARFLEAGRADARSRGAQFQRLDCRDQLLRIYEPLGFVRVGEKEFPADQVGLSGFSGYRVNLMQREA
ncbi:hypothetical protein [Helcobacillus massiliensis]|uniref:hypothetical protein n=1 Tax=Helcobacillus massiliensis TaxID=521392 RepID=UPI002556517F|nr:hypothetical protein [Helcobacillus massiliensis]MDK7741312.1 hypothetical protein [Helcobacillus massiliensis]WOO92837.1 hypothetical protein R3I40_10590 [Helcobacillus massiliensis]